MFQSCVHGDILQEFSALSLDEKIDYIERLLDEDRAKKNWGEYDEDDVTETKRKRKLSRTRGLDLTDEVKEEIRKQCSVFRHSF